MRHACNFHLWRPAYIYCYGRHASILHQGGTPAFSHDGGTPHPQWRLVETLIAVHLILEFAGWQVSAVLFRWHACNFSFVAARLHLLLGAARLHFTSRRHACNFQKWRHPSSSLKTGWNFNSGAPYPWICWLSSVCWTGKIWCKPR